MRTILHLVQLRLDMADTLDLMRRAGSGPDRADLADTFVSLRASAAEAAGRLGDVEPNPDPSSDFQTLARNPALQREIGHLAGNGAVNDAEGMRRLLTRSDQAIAVMTAYADPVLRALGLDPEATRQLDAADHSLANRFWQRGAIDAAKPLFSELSAREKALDMARVQDDAMQNSLLGRLVRAITPGRQPDPSDASAARPALAQRPRPATP